MSAPELTAEERDIVARFEAAPVIEEEIRERVARAIWEDQMPAFVPGGSWTFADEHLKRLCRRLADAAIYAMRATS